MVISKISCIFEFNGRKGLDNFFLFLCVKDERLKLVDFFTIKEVDTFENLNVFNITILMATGCQQT